ncbi:MAG: response regulator [Acidobacteria bacterium]|nr:response regulator [Acidobacteriota bacterium]
MALSPNIVLLIEDNPGDQRLMSEALADAHVDCELRIISNGARALECARIIGLNTAVPVPAVFILDLHLPCVDGCDILKALRENPSCAKTPVVAVSSFLTPAESDAVSRFPNVEHVLKGSTLDDFMRIGRVVASLLHARGSPVNNDMPGSRGQVTARRMDCCA